MCSYSCSLTACLDNTSPTGLANLLKAPEGTTLAGIMALPQAVATLGIVLGSVLILLVYILSYVTIDILARLVSRLDITVAPLRRLQENWDACMK